MEQTSPLKCGEKTAMAIAAHPDDIEFMMSGTLMRLSDAGWNTHYMNVANGCCGSIEHDAVITARIREQEAKQAAKLLGAVWYPPLANDAEIFYNKPLLQQLAAIIRSVAPDILLIHSPVDYMEDHTNACRLAVTAAFVRGIPNYETKPQREPIDKPVALYHAMPHELCDPFGETVQARMFVDVTNLMGRKRDALAAHISQKNWLDHSQGMDSYLLNMESTAKRVGEQSGVFELAEGWRPHSHMGFCTRDANPLKEALGDHFSP
ncbi:MAG: LmbE family protein [Verrucomicrobia bacterium]|jgi:N-acetylglucosamine malate deacetylase 1|nr:LmbE family protein [Verrucomicrobiota bacterium]